MQPMKQSPLEVFLDRLDPTRRADQLAFFRTIAEIGPTSVKELAGRVHQVSCPAGLRRLTLEFTYYTPWPEWLPMVDRLLRHEKDLSFFETGVRALGRMRTPKALAALRSLAQGRAEEGFREVVDQVLRESDPAEAFKHHFTRLLQGSAQPADANEGARQLENLLSPESLEPLQAAVSHPDPLVFRHAIRLVGRIPTPETAAFLLGYLEETHQEALAQRAARNSEAAADPATQHARRLEFGLDAAAQGLANLALLGHIDPGPLLPVLAACLKEHTGRAGVASALARLVPPEDQERLDLLLDEPEGALRAAAVEVLGERKDVAFQPALLKVRKDALTDIAQRALWHLGQLPDPEGTAQRFLSHSDPEEVLIGLRFTAMHRLEALVPDLLDLLTQENREGVMVAALETLGSLGSSRAVDPLLALLHSGQSPRIQLALAEALRDLGDDAGARALVARAEELKAPLLCVVAVEALARAHDGPDRPLSGPASADLLRAVRGGWSDRNPWPLRRRIASALLALQSEDKVLWADLSDLVQATLGEKRPPGTVAPEDLASLQTCAKVLAQKSA